ncbi:hypothetical protein, partial [Escherichia coli]|uniref:hypothetical protein n=1 Tax=Escherichia coli TaxID=562 RepID=UPI003D80C8C7
MFNLVAQLSQLAFVLQRLFLMGQQRRDLWEAENQYVVLKEAATKRQLSEQEKSLLAHEKETLEYKRQLAELGDKIEHQ